MRDDFQRVSCVSERNTCTVHRILGRQLPKMANPRVITEGTARVPIPDQVFYNPVQVFNRDLSVLVVRTFIDTLKYESTQARRPKPFGGVDMIEGLSATGLRSIRMWNEVNALAEDPSDLRDLRSIVINDLDSKAVEEIEQNLESNGLGALTLPWNSSISESRPLRVSCGDCNLVMTLGDAVHRQLMRKTVDSESPQRFHIVDLDPYGSASHFLAAGITSILDGGLLCVTSTDSSVLSGKWNDKSWALYSSAPPFNSSFHHEIAVRTLLHTISVEAGRQGRYIVPSLSLSEC